MLYSEIIAVFCEIHTKHINTLRGKNVEFVDVFSSYRTVNTHRLGYKTQTVLCGLNVEFLNVKLGWYINNHWALMV